MFTRFVIFLISSLGVIGIASYAIYKAYTNMGALAGTPAKILLWLLITMPIIFVGTTIVLMKVNIKILNPLYTVSTTWLPILAYLFISAVILTVTTSLLPAGIITPSFYKTLCIGSIYLISALVTFGLINSQIPRLTYVTIPKENRLHEKLSGKKLVLVSDTHIGNINNKRFLTKVVNKINGIEADGVLFAGDLVDGPKINFEKSLLPLANFNKPVYYAPGNHEVYSAQEKALYEVTDKYINGLRNQKTDFMGVKIIGLTYDAYEGRDALIQRLNSAGFNPTEETIVIHHDPKNNKFLQEAGVDLIVSGHTHGGQFWPFTSVVKRIFGPYVHGLYTINQKSSVTTWGVGTWGPNVRIGTKSEIIIISFE